MTNKPAQLGKRILAALLDLMMIYFLVIFATWLVSLTPLGVAFNNSNKEYETLYNSFALQEGYHVWVQNNGSSSLSIVSNSSIFANFQSAALADSTFVSVMKATRNYYLIINILSVLLVESIYLGLMPILNNKGQTLGKMVMGLGVLDAKYDMFASRKQKLIRALMGVGVETVLVMLIFSNNTGIVIFMSPLIVLMTIMISPSKQALHDSIAKTKVVDLYTATIFDSIEEKEKFDASLKQGEDVDGETLETFVTEINETEEPLVEGTNEQPVDEEVETEVTDSQDDNKE